MSTPQESGIKPVALRFISGKYQGGEFPLKPDKQVIIGRSSELDMVLVEDMVSRKHAKITFVGGHLTIEDLGSTNGTFVNGEKIRQSRLKEGDRVLIGTSILRVVDQSSTSGEMDEAMVRKRLEEAAAQSARQPKASSMSGKIEEIPIPDLLQLFGTSKKNGVLIIREGGREGRIYMRTGRVYYAVIDDNHEMGPQKSFNRIVTWENGDFELAPPSDEEFMIELDSSTEALLMDALRLQDELRRSQKDLPPSDAALTLNPHGPPWRELTPDELDLIQLIHAHGTLQGVLDNSLKDDVATAELLVPLLKREYLKTG